METPSIFPEKSRCTYTSCYCEENVWKLCEYIECNRPEILSECYAIFISNPKKAVPLWRQKAAQTAESAVVWDYHVIFIHKSEDGVATVYDLDTSLSFPCSFETYKNQALKSDELLKPEYYRMFRVVPAEVYLRSFASNRNHMIDKKSMKYLKPPPSYPAIKTANCDNNIEEFMCMESGLGHGTVMNMDGFLYFFQDN